MKPEHLQTGARGEQQAADYLESMGYLILARNWRVGKSEVDIIAGREDEVIFVEVKTRKNLRHGLPELLVNAAKEKKMQEAAKSFLECIQPGHTIRFDIIAIIENGEEQGIHHVENAFLGKTERWR